MSESDGTGNIDDKLVNRTGILAEMLSYEPQANSTVFMGVHKIQATQPKRTKDLVLLRTKI